MLDTLGTHTPPNSLYMPFEYTLPYQTVFYAQWAHTAPLDSPFYANTWRLLRWLPVTPLFQVNKAPIIVLFPPSPFSDHFTNIRTVDATSPEALSAPSVALSPTLLISVDLFGGAYPNSPNDSKMATLKLLFFFVLPSCWRRRMCRHNIRHSDVSRVCPIAVHTLQPSRGRTINYYNLLFENDLHNK
jgi:hypothetical protein